MYPPGFNSPTRFEAEIHDCEVWGRFPPTSKARSIACTVTSSIARHSMSARRNGMLTKG